MSGNLVSPSATPVPVTGLAMGVVKVVATSRTACALTDKGGVKCWGSPVAVGATEDVAQFGGAASTPQDVLGLTSGVKAIAAGARHVCALMANGGIQCWGYNENGQLGNQPASISSDETEWVPVSVIGVTDAIAVGGGASQTCAALASGGVKCWGSGPASGSKLSTNQLVPAYVSGI